MNGDLCEPIPLLMVYTDDHGSYDINLTVCEVHEWTRSEVVIETFINEIRRGSVNPRVPAAVVHTASPFPPRSSIQSDRVPLVFSCS